jgi:dCTP deaminase
VARLEGKSSLGRLGLIIHAMAGFIDPGNKLRVTLHMGNLSPLPIKVYGGMKIAQIDFEEVDQQVERPYGSKGLNSKYLNVMDVQASDIYKNFTKEKK